VLLIRSTAAAATRPPGGTRTNASAPTTTAAAVVVTTTADGCRLVRLFVDSNNNNNYAVTDDRVPDAEATTVLDASPRWTLIDGGGGGDDGGGCGGGAHCCLLAMTGLASDADHLTRIVQHHADVHRIVYDDAGGVGGGSSHFFGPGHAVKHLQEALYQATKWNDGGRPFGVQALVVGTSAPSSSSSRPPASSWVVATVDPSGGYRHWGVATAIGRNARQIRKQLAECLSLLSSSQPKPEGHEKHGDDTPSAKVRNEPTCPASATEALGVALRASMRADDPPSADGKGDDDDDPKHTYQALLLQLLRKRKGNGNASRIRHAIRVGIIDPDQVGSIRKAIRSDEREKKIEAKKESASTKKGT